MSNEKQSIFGILVVSAIALLFLTCLIYLNPFQPTTKYSFVAYLPAINAIFNSMATCSLLIGIYFIKKKERLMHKRFMIAAFIFSSAFLVSYIIYHYFHGDSAFQGQGQIRYLYFFILISHIILSICGLPFILLTFYFSLTDKIVKHRKIAKITFPIWLYVSITGVLIYFFLVIYNQ